MVVHQPQLRGFPFLDKPQIQLLRRSAFGYCVISILVLAEEHH